MTLHIKGGKEFWRDVERVAKLLSEHDEGHATSQGEVGFSEGATEDDARIVWEASPRDDSAFTYWIGPGECPFPSFDDPASDTE